MTSHERIERAWTESELWNSEERFRLLVEGVLDYAIFMLDANGYVMTWNIGAERIKGYTAAEVIGKHFSTFYTPDAIEQRWPEQELKLAKERGRFEDEGWRVRKDGSRFWASVLITPILDRGGDCRGFSKVTRDLTERRRSMLMAERRATQLRGLAMELTNVEQRERRRLAQILHDHIQQLLVAAKIKLHSIKKSIDAPGVVNSVESLDELLSEIIDACRSLSVDISPPIIREAGLARSLHWLAGRVSQMQKLEVEVIADEANDPKSEAIRFLLFDAARELLLNVTKHAGTDRARMTLKRTPESLVSLKVEDHGVGFPSQECDEHGFGLMSLRERTYALGGVMEFAPRVGGGTVVTLAVPDIDPGQEANSPPAGEDTGALPQDSKVGVDLDPMSVLLVDDHFIVRQGLVGLLNMTPGMSVVGEASNGMEAVEKVRTLKPDVVIMDVNMPIMNGIEATRQIKLEFADKVAVIGLSIYTEDQISKSMREAGAQAYLAKSAPPEVLIRAIRDCGRSRS